MRACASGDHWYKSNNGTATPVQFTSDGFGAYTRAEVPTNNRSMMMIKYQSPHLITYYDGIGSLNEATKENGIITDIDRKQDEFIISMVTSVVDNKNNKKDIILSFDDTKCEIVDSDSLGDDLAIVKIKDISVENIIQRKDLSAIPIAVDLKRDGKIIRSYKGANFDRLRRSNFSDINLLADDQLILKLERSYKKVWSYKNIELIDHSLSYALKETLSDKLVELLPADYSLDQNYPNPFNPTTTISFTLPEQEFVKLNIYNVNGQLVKNVLNGFQNAGKNIVQFNSSTVASGVYFYRIEAGNFTQTKRMIVLK